jgi:hypothetical protein
MLRWHLIFHVVLVLMFREHRLFEFTKLNTHKHHGIERIGAAAGRHRDEFLVHTDIHQML